MYDILGTSTDPNPTTDMLADEPDSISINATEQEKWWYSTALHSYWYDMLECFKNTSFEAEDLCIEFTSTFPYHFIEEMTTSFIIEWIDLLISRGVHFNSVKGIYAANAYVKYLTCDAFTS